MLSIIKRVNIKSSQEPKNLDNEFEWEEGFLNEKKRNYTKQLQSYGLAIAEVAPEELYFLNKIDYGMLQPKEKNAYLMTFYEHNQVKY